MCIKEELSVARLHHVCFFQVILQKFKGCAELLIRKENISKVSHTKFVRVMNSAHLSRQTYKKASHHSVDGLKDRQA